MCSQPITCPWGHHQLQNGSSASETRRVLKPLVPSLTCSSLSRSRSNASEPFDPLISQLKAFLRPGAKRVASIVPIAPLSKRTAASKASSTSRPGWNVAVSAETVSISPTR